MKDFAIISKAIEDKTIVWFETNNKYSILEQRAAKIVEQLSNDKAVEVIADEVANDLNVPFEKAIDFVIKLNKDLYKPNLKKEVNLTDDYRDLVKPQEFDYVKHYQINNLTLTSYFKTEKELDLIHPKFEHLEVNTSNSSDVVFEVFSQHNYTFLFVDKKFIGAWGTKDIHYFQGKFLMELIQKIHQKNEDEWLGVFHASALTNGKKSILFLGDSGNGKSTSLALLQANGFTCLADDFVPVDARNKEVFAFPAAISIKKNSLPILAPFYPELESIKEYSLKVSNKIVRYLKPNNSDYSLHLPCNDLVFIKYEQGVELDFNPISKLEAFQQLIPDSWLSPKKENAQLFLDWFATTNCYELTYSDNEKMINQVRNLFDDEL
ncbi:MAG: hypothetical protein HWD82_07205 [Flavobacteriaceae bacterium]|nr:hypothetical protein [Flavobacteriaceae bacterium]